MNQFKLKDLVRLIGGIDVYTIERFDKGDKVLIKSKTQGDEYIVALDRLEVIPAHLRGYYK